MVTMRSSNRALQLGAKPDIIQNQPLCSIRHRCPCSIPQPSLITGRKLPWSCHFTNRVIKTSPLFLVNPITLCGWMTAVIMRGVFLLIGLMETLITGVQEFLLILRALITIQPKITLKHYRGQDGGGPGTLSFSYASGSWVFRVNGSVIDNNDSVVGSIN